MNPRSRAYALLLFAATMTCSSRADDVAKTKYWIFLVLGKSAAGVAKEEIQAKQQAHLANFRRLAKDKLLLAAGPMADPAKTLRGIVVVQADEEQKIPSYFGPDPYVGEGFMKLEVNRVADMVGDLTVPTEVTSMEQLRIVVWDQIKSEGKLAALSAEQLTQHTDYWNHLREDGHVAVRCRFADNAPRFGVAILPTASDEQIKKWLDEDPLVVQKKVQYQVMPQYLAKGTVRFTK